MPPPTQPSPPPIRTDFLERDQKTKQFTGKVSWPWIKWLLELYGVAPIDPDNLIALTIQETPAVDIAELAAQEAVLAAQPEPSSVNETQVSEISGGVALALAGIPSTLDEAKVEEIAGGIAQVLDDPIPAPVIPAYGGMFVYALGGGAITITVAATDTWYMVDTGLSAMAAVALTEFQNSREIKILYPGVYAINWSMSAECTAANQEVEGSLMISGTEQTESSAHTELAVANKARVLAATWVGYLLQDDLVQLAVLNHTATNDIVIDHVNLSVVRIGD